jgi:endonuclease V-like protein UPF0215 family
MPVRRPHLLGVDDGPFDKRRDRSVTLVAVLMEGHDLVEAVAVTEFPVDGADAAGFLADWIGGLRFASGLHAVVLGGITIAGLGVVDSRALAARLGLPVIAVHRQPPEDRPLVDALGAAGLEERIPLVQAAPDAWQLDEGLWVAQAGAGRNEVRALLERARGKSRLPEALRLAHLIGGAVAAGQSRGRP